MKPAAIIACGPSLTQEQVDACRDRFKIYVVNNAYKLAPWADVLYACDDAWWRHYKPEFSGEKWTISEKSAQEYGLNLIARDRQALFSTTKGLIATGYNSGFQALNLAYEQGCRQAILLGFDYKNPGMHFFGKHSGELNRSSNMNRWVTYMHNAAPMMKEAGYEVINCTPDSAIKSFPFMSIEDALYKLSHREL